MIVTSVDNAVSQSGNVKVALYIKIDFINI